MQYHLFTDYPGEQLPGIIVPQLVWFNPQAPHTHPLPPVRFTAYGHNGVSIANLLNTPPAGMPDAATIPQLGGAQRISFRVCWPGYSAWSLAINTFSNAANGGPHNKGRIAVSVANAIRQFLLDMAAVAPSQAAQWATNTIRIEELYLLELRNVSVGSWQAVICLRR